MAKLLLIFFIGIASLSARAQTCEAYFALSRQQQTLQSLLEKAIQKGLFISQDISSLEKFRSILKSIYWQGVAERQYAIALNKATTDMPLDILKQNLESFADRLQSQMERQQQYKNKTRNLEIPSLIKRVQARKHPWVQEFTGSDGNSYMYIYGMAHDLKKDFHIINPKNGPLSLKAVIEIPSPGNYSFVGGYLLLTENLPNEIKRYSLLDPLNSLFQKTFEAADVGIKKVGINSESEIFVLQEKEGSLYFYSNADKQGQKISVGNFTNSNQITIQTVTSAQNGNYALILNQSESSLRLLDLDRPSQQLPSISLKDLQQNSVNPSANYGFFHKSANIGADQQGNAILRVLLTSTNVGKSIQYLEYNLTEQQILEQKTISPGEFVFAGQYVYLRKNDSIDVILFADSSKDGPKKSRRFEKMIYYNSATRTVKELEGQGHLVLAGNNEFVVFDNVRKTLIHFNENLETTELPMTNYIEKYSNLEFNKGYIEDGILYLPFGESIKDSQSSILRWNMKDRTHKETYPIENRVHEIHVNSSQFFYIKQHWKPTLDLMRYSTEALQKDIESNN